MMGEEWGGAVEVVKGGRGREDKDGENDGIMCNGE
jgi:hypothetical protein